MRLLTLALPLATLSLLGSPTTTINAPMPALSSPAGAPGPTLADDAVTVAARLDGARPVKADQAVAGPLAPNRAAAGPAGPAIAGPVMPRPTVAHETAPGHGEGAERAVSRSGVILTGVTVKDPYAPIPRTASRVVSEAISALVPAGHRPEPDDAIASTPSPAQIQLLSERLRQAGSTVAFSDRDLLRQHSSGGRHLVGIAVAPDGRGYWAVDAQGTVFAYGDVSDYGSLGRYHAAGGVAGLAATPTSQGYWVVSKDGGVFSFGDAAFYGSLGKTPLKTPVVSITPTPSGHGYWLVTAGGDVYTFGNAKFFGSLDQANTNAPVVGIASSPDGHGYWLATAGGGVFTFGNAKFFGSLSLSGATLSNIAATRPSQGYWLLTSEGAVHGFGAAADPGPTTITSGFRVDTREQTIDERGYIWARTAGAAAAQGAELRSAQQTELASAAPKRTFLGNFLVTCYDLTGATATGAMAGLESVAVDPQVVPLGAHIYVQGVGERTADDTGGAIVGNHIDIWEPSYGECTDWGVQMRPVYRVNGS